MNFTKVARTRTRTRTTIFKLIGPCEILSHGQKNPENPEYPKKSRIPLFNCNGKHVLHEWILKAMWVGKRCKGTPQSPQIPKDSLLPRKFYDNGKHQRAHQCSHIQFHRWKTSNLARQCSGASEILKTKENL